MRTRLDLHLLTIVSFLDQALAGFTVEGRTTSPTRDFYHAGPLPVDPIKIYSCNVTSLQTPRHTSNIRMILVQRDLQGYNPRNGQGLP